MGKATYKDAGVDLEVYEQAMARLPRLMHRTFSPRVLRSDGGFAGLFQLDFDSRLFARHYQDPVLVSCTDGVGTKLKVAQQLGQHRTIGIDLVAMSVNDAICCGAEPLFFLDYVAMAQDDPELLEQIVQGISDGCIQADCSLLGGETAIMPDVYRPGDYDLAGFCVGVVERRQVIQGRAISPGDSVLGLASSGLHSNGYSLARKVAFEIAGLDVTQPAPFDPQSTLGESLLAPTRIYAEPVRRILSHYKVKNVVHGIAHVTGGGLHENVRRILPNHVKVVVDRDTWPVPPIFPWLQAAGEIDAHEMERVFNMGIGLVLIVSAYYADTIAKICEDQGFPTFKIGEVQQGTGCVAWATA